MKSKKYETKCIICERKFLKYGKVGRHNDKSYRPHHCLTCSKICSKAYMRIQNRMKNRIKKLMLENKKQ